MILRLKRHIESIAVLLLEEQTAAVIVAIVILLSDHRY